MAIIKKLIALLFTLTACGGTPDRLGRAHSVDAATAQAGAESAKPTVGAQSVVISGTVNDCNVPGNGQPMTPAPIRAFPVKAFDPASNSKLVRILRSLDTLNMIGPPPAPANWNSAYRQLKSLWASATALTHDSTSSTGSFSLTVPSMDSVLVFGFTEVEDANAYYQYHMVGGRSNVSVLFDMAGGECGPASDTTKGR